MTTTVTEQAIHQDTTPAAPASTANPIGGHEYRVPGTDRASAVVRENGHFDLLVATIGGFVRIPLPGGHSNHPEAIMRSVRDLKDLVHAATEAMARQAEELEVAVATYAANELAPVAQLHRPQATPMSTPQATPMAAPPARDDATQVLPVAGRVGHVNPADVAEGLEPRAWNSPLVGEAWSGVAPGDEHRARTVEAMGRPDAADTAADATVAVLDQPVPEEPQRPARGRKARSS